MEREDKNPGLADILKGVLKDTGLQKAKDELARAMREEIERRLAGLDAKKVIKFLVDNYDIEVNAKFSLKEKKRPGE